MTSKTAATMTIERPSRQVAITIAELADSRISGAAKEMPMSDAANTSTGERRETGESLGADEAGIATGKGAAQHGTRAHDRCRSLSLRLASPP